MNIYLFIFRISDLPICFLINCECVIDANKSGIVNLYKSERDVILIPIWPVQWKKKIKKNLTDTLKTLI